MHDLRYNINYWQTKTGLEVDFILDDGKIAIEVKISKNVCKQDIKDFLTKLWAGEIIYLHS